MVQVIVVAPLRVRAGRQSVNKLKERNAPDQPED
jgi:hypothetical protein